MRNLFLGFVSALAFPAMASAALQLNIQSLNVTAPAAGEADQTSFVEVFFTETDPQVEALGSASINVGLSGAGVGGTGVRFGPATSIGATETKPFVFAGFTTEFENLGTNATTAFFSVDIPDPSNPRRSLSTDPDNNEGVLRIPVIIPAGTTAGTFNLNFSPLFTALNGPLGEEIDFTTSGGSIVVTAAPIPEPASLGLLAVGGLLALRRRRAA